MATTDKFLGHCKHCNGTARVVPVLVKKVSVSVGYGRSETVYVWQLPHGGTVRGDFGHFFSQCVCGKPVHFKRLVGRFSSKKVCNDKCMSAHGPSCECQCAGANHGGAFA